MKYLLLLLITFNAHAWFVAVGDNYDSETKNIVYPKRKQCRIDHPEKYCIKMPKGFRKEYYNAESILGNDKSKPIYAAKSQVSACSDKEECEAMLEIKKCSGKKEAFINADFTEVYCTKVSGYEQKIVGKKLILDEDKKAAKDAEKEAAKAERKAKKKEIKDILDANPDLKKVLEFYGISN